MTPDEGNSPQRCDFCRMHCPENPVTMDHEGTTYTFCCTACRDAMAESDRVFTEYRGYHRFKPGIAALDATLPQGMMRNSLVLLSGQAGTRDTSIHAEVVWRALQRGEPAVYVTFQEPPMSVVEQFLTLDWNVLPYLENGQLHVLDAFTYRLDDVDRMHDRMNDWNRHLFDVVDPVTTRVRDASDVSELENKLDSCMEALEMVDRGVVLIDSLTELGTLVQPVQAYDFVKDLRADVCKGRFVPIFAGATYSGDADAFPHDLDYTADGVVDMELNNEIVPNTLIKRMRIRKMNGVLAYPEWTAYEYTAGRGMVRFDPEEEIQRAMESAPDEGGGGSEEGERGDGNGESVDGESDDGNGEAGAETEGEGGEKGDTSSG